jgi:predicted metal-dependent HD superfamily phosphohydrolase
MTKQEAMHLIMINAQKWYKAGYRPYHNFHHAMDVYIQVYQARPDDIALQLAALYHDAVYIVGFGDNETLSAKALHNDFNSYINNTDTILSDKEDNYVIMHNACRYICCTTIQDHMSPSLIQLQYPYGTDLLLDADLSSLGNCYSVFTYNQFNILKENNLDITNKQHIKKQIDFLNKLAGSRDNIFRTKEYINKYEQQARDNINRFTKEHA